MVLVDDPLFKDLAFELQSGDLLRDVVEVDGDGLLVVEYLKGLDSDLSVLL